jgi:hypothetical protein
MHMQYTSSLRWLAMVLRIERAAARHGYSADALADDTTLPDTGTYRQQLDMAAIALDSGIRLHELSTRDAATVRRMVRTCVLSPRPAQSAPQPPRPARRRAW